MDLENEIKTLRKTFTDKSADCVNLLKEVCVTDAGLRFSVLILRGSASFKAYYFSKLKSYEL